MFAQICFYLIIFVLVPNLLYSQSAGVPPYKLSRLFHFQISESIAYDTNVFKVSGDDGKYWILGHSFSISHADQRPWYNYNFNYGFNYQNYIGHSEYDDSGHSLSMNINIPRKDGSISFFENFLVSSDPLSLEFSGLVRSYSNNFGTSFNYQLFHYIGVSGSIRYNFYRYPDNNRQYFRYSSFDLDSESLYSNAQIGYYFTRQISISVGINHEIQWRNSYRSDNYSVPIHLNFQLRDPNNKNVEGIEWFRSLNFSIGYSFSEDNLGIPIDLSISIAGDFPNKTNWGFSVSRSIQYALASGDLSYNTSVSLKINHNFTPDFSAGFNVGYERIEYKEYDSLNGINTGVAAQYAITKWISIQISYGMSYRFSKQEWNRGISHRISMGTGLSF